MSITKDMPEGCALIRAELVKEGDRVRFRNDRFDYTVQRVDVGPIGNVVHYFNNETAFSSYQPHELLWITRRNDSRGAA